MSVEVVLVGVRKLAGAAHGCWKSSVGVQEEMSCCHGCRVTGWCSMGWPVRWQQEAS